MKAFFGGVSVFFLILTHCTPADEPGSETLATQQGTADFAQDNVCSDEDKLWKTFDEDNNKYDRVPTDLDDAYDLIAARFSEKGITAELKFRVKCGNNKEYFALVHTTKDNKKATLVDFAIDGPSEDKSKKLLARTEQILEDTPLAQLEELRAAWMAFHGVARSKFERSRTPEEKEAEKRLRHTDFKRYVEQADQRNHETLAKAYGIEVTIPNAISIDKRFSPERQRGWQMVYAKVWHCNDEGATYYTYLKKPTWIPYVEYFPGQKTYTGKTFQGGSRELLIALVAGSLEISRELLVILDDNIENCKKASVSVDPFESLGNQNCDQGENCNWFHVKREVQKSMYEAGFEVSE